VQLFKRSIPYGKQTIIRNLAEFKSIDEEEAEAILSDPRKLGQELTPEEYSEVIRDFSSSVTRMAEFHTSRNPGTVIEQIRLMGTGINLIGFTEILGKELGLEVVTIKELNGVKIAKKNLHGLNYELLADYLPLLGSMMQSLNLKAGEEKKGTESYTVFYVILILSAVSVLSASGFFFYIYHVQKGVKANLEQEIANLSQVEETYSDYLDNQQKYELLKQYYDGTVNNSEQLYQLILDLEQVMPKSVGINTFTITNGEISMTCMASGKEAVADFVIELKKIPYVSDVRVENITDTYDEFSQVTSTFNLSFNIGVINDEEAEGGSEE